jgi:hypothetical protein
MARHLKACKPRLEEIEKSRVEGGAENFIFHIQVEGLHLPMYWMHIEVPAKATLSNLDGFLRETWLECCGHLSSFEIGDRGYLSEPDDEGLGYRSMRISLGKVIAPGMKLEHVYDFGTSTELTLKVLSARNASVRGKAVRILARNDPPDIRCECGKQATAVCAQCVYEGRGWVCEGCAGAHECGEDMLLPVVNSPRVGACGYTGEPY